MQVVNAHVLDKNEKCITHFQTVMPDDPEILDVKSFLIGDIKTYRCAVCFDEHQFKDALFAHQKTNWWDGLDPTLPEAKPMHLSVQRGEDEFTVKVIPTPEAY